VDTENTDAHVDTENTDAHVDTENTDAHVDTENTDAFCSSRVSNPAIAPLQIVSHADAAVPTLTGALLVTCIEVSNTDAKRLPVVHS